MRRLAQFDLKSNIVTKFMPIPKRPKRYRLELFYEKDGVEHKRHLTTDTPYLYAQLQPLFVQEISDFFPDDVDAGGYKLDIIK